MMYPQKRPLKSEKVVSKPVNIANLINEKMQERERGNENGGKNPFQKRSPLTMNSGVVEVSIESKEKSTSSLREYVEILELKGKRCEEEIEGWKRKVNQCQVKDQFDNILKQSYYYGLEEYYTKSRKILVDVSYELVDCKGVLMSYSQSVKFKTRIQSLTGLLTKIQVFMKSNSIDVNKPLSITQDSKTTLSQLRSIIQIQQKSIKHLKQLSKYPTQQCFQQQKRLLRYQINRVFTQNQKLKQNCGQTYSQFLTRLKQRDFQNERLVLHQTIKEYFDLMNSQFQMKDVEYRHRVEREFIQNRLEEERGVMKELEMESEGVRRENVRISGERRLLEEEVRMVSNQNLGFKMEVKRLEGVEKEYRGEIERMREENGRLGLRIERLLEQNRGMSEVHRMSREETHPRIDPISEHQKSVRETQLQEQLHELKQRLIVTQVLLQQSNSRLKLSKEDQEQPQPSLHPIRHSSQNMNSIHSFQHTLQQKTMFLQEYLRENSEDYYLIFREFKRGVDERVEEYKGVVERQNEQKQVIMGWCKKVYLLLKQSDIPESVIQEHLKELQEISKVKKGKGSKINRLLESVRECSNGLDRHQQREIEEELEEYVITLKKRGDVIQEVSNEDGSSVATSLADFRSEAFTDFEERLSDLND